jgi:hypothetical protein
MTLGLHGSASTWVFNVARELLVATYGPDKVHSCFAGKTEDLSDAATPPGRHIVAKTHGWPSMPAFAREWGGRLLISVRDPRDAVLSVMQRFGEPFDRSLRGVGQDCRVTMACAGAGVAVLRYEDRFFERPAAVPAIAEHLGLPVAPATAARVFRDYSTDAVRRFAAGVPALPAERLSGPGPVQFDLLTHITNTHIGDGRVGKWRDLLAPEQRAFATMYLAPFLRRFGYPVTAD